MYKALEVSRYVIRYCDSKNSNVSNLKLQKILYFIQAEFLVDTGERCFPERIEAWDFGPVVPEVYRRYKIYGGSYIPVPKNDDYFTFSKEDKKRIEHIVDECIPYSAAQLVEITHHQTPWIEAYHQERIGENEISPESIQRFFTEE